MTIRINGEYFVLWRAVDSDGYELDVFLQKHKNKKAAIPSMCSESDHRSHKGLNNRVENDSSAHSKTGKDNN